MNAELSARGLCRVVVPLCYRDEYLSALRALSHNANPTPLWRMIDRAQRWASLMPWTGRDHVRSLLEHTNALVTPERATAENLHLLDPGPDTFVERLGAAPPGDLDEADRVRRVGRKP